jgi:hypothetical protein
MSKLLAYTIGGQKIGIDIQTWNDQMLSGHTAFTTMADNGTPPANYVDISSVAYWSQFGNPAGFSDAQVKAEIVKLIPGSPTAAQYLILQNYMNVGINSMSKVGDTAVLGGVLTGTTVLTGITNGNQYQRFQNMASVGTSSTTVNAPYLTGRTANLPAGTYKFSATWMWSRSATTNYGQNSFTIDGVVQGTRSNMYMRSVNTIDIYAEYREYYITFATPSTHTFTFNVWNNAGTTTISDVVFEILRIT